MQKESNKSRRNFIEKSLKLLVGSSLITPAAYSCSEGFYRTLTIDEALCIGCSDCNDVCNYNAIIMNGVSNYSINISNCTLCSWCVSVCEDNAIQMPEKNYKIISTECTGCNECLPSCDYGALKIASNNFTIKAGCIGCGDCITVCTNEGEAIQYVVSEYSVRGGQCHGCVSRCSGACKYGAISNKNGRAYIDILKCTKCGDCYKACAHNAIKKAYVTIVQDKCTHCGKCYEACSYEQIDKSGDSDIKESHIKRLACTNCGECIAACPEDAIYLEESGDYDPEILNDDCTACGKCFDTCAEQSAIERSTATAEIDQIHCMKCNKCLDVCEYDAVLAG